MMAAKVAAVFVTSQTSSSATTHNMYLTLLTDLSVSVLMPRVIFLARQFIFIFQVVTGEEKNSLKSNWKSRLEHFSFFVVSLLESHSLNKNSNGQLLNTQLALLSGEQQAKNVVKLGFEDNICF